MLKKQSVSGSVKLERPQKPKGAEDVYQQVLVERLKNDALKGCLNALGASLPFLEVRSWGDWKEICRISALNKSSPKRQGSFAAQLSCRHTKAQHHVKKSGLLKHCLCAPLQNEAEKRATEQWADLEKSEKLAYISIAEGAVSRASTSPVPSEILSVLQCAFFTTAVASAEAAPLHSFVITCSALVMSPARSLLATSTVLILRPLSEHDAAGFGCSRLQTVSTATSCTPCAQHRLMQLSRAR